MYEYFFKNNSANKYLDQICPIIALDVFNNNEFITGSIQSRIADNPAYIALWDKRSSTKQPLYTLNKSNTSAIRCCMVSRFNPNNIAIGDQNGYISLLDKRKMNSIRLSFKVRRVALLQKQKYYHRNRK